MSWTIGESQHSVVPLWLVCCPRWQGNALGSSVPSKLPSASAHSVRAIAQHTRQVLCLCLWHSRWCSSWLSPWGLWFFTPFSRASAEILPPWNDTVTLDILHWGSLSSLPVLRNLSAPVPVQSPHWLYQPLLFQCCSFLHFQFFIVLLHVVVLAPDYLLK